jgi:hypothetical protein
MNRRALSRKRNAARFPRRAEGEAAIGKPCSYLRTASHTFYEGEQSDSFVSL